VEFLKKDVECIIKTLRKTYPKAFFRGSDPFRVLISTILSQRTRDENTVIASRDLFSIYKNALALSQADEKHLQKLIKCVGFYRIKAKRIKEVSKIILERYNGKVPDNIDDLLSLPAVGRKTANCVLVYGFMKPAIPVDTHVHRVSNRLGLVNTKTPTQTETSLKKTIPKKYWIDLNELFVRHGQNICKPIVPKCSECVINKMCKYWKTIKKI
jgi:endonuclease-3